MNRIGNWTMKSEANLAITKVNNMKERFKIIEIKVRQSGDLAAVLNKKIKPSWHIISADFLCAVGDWWLYKVVVDASPVGGMARTPTPTRPVRK